MQELPADELVLGGEHDGLSSALRSGLGSGFGSEALI